MPRKANAVDFWRGFALVSIFINHIPGIWYERLTHRNVSISDSAELFVFLAGWSLGLLVRGRPELVSAGRLDGTQIVPNGRIDGGLSTGRHSLVLLEEPLRPRSETQPRSRHQYF